MTNFACFQKGVVSDSLSTTTYCLCFYNASSNAYIVENEITYDHQIHCFLIVEDGLHMGRHALPKVHKEVLHFVEVGSHNTIQDPLAVSSVHEQEGFHLKRRKGQSYRESGSREKKK